MTDILFQNDAFVFSYRAAGICIQNGRVLLQRPRNDDGFAFPGGHVAFEETNEQTLIREFREEIGADIKVGALKWVGEIFFPWGSRPCHQICLYYMVEITGGDVPEEGMFLGKEHFQNQNFELEFHWIPLDAVKNILLYPENCAELLRKIDFGVQHFVYREKEN